MFALALWDRRERRLSLARDRMGEKPLYWGWAGSALVFASELKSIVQHPDFDQTLCKGALAQYLRFAYVPAPRSIYRSVFKIEPGTVLEVFGAPPPTPPQEPLQPGERYGSIAIRRYWSLIETLAAGAQDPLGDETEAVTKVEKALTGAVHRQTISDVPLGTFLSGGIDSSTIAVLLQAQSARPVRTFAVGFDEAAFDEAPYAAAVARHLGTQHTELRVTARDALAVIPALPQIYDEPFADSSQIPTYLICRAARTQATVAMSGDGGDELFGGYNRYLWGPRIWGKLSRVPWPIRQALGAGVGAMPQRFWRTMDWSSRQLGGPRLSQVGEILATSLGEVRESGELYRSLVSQWPNPSALIMDDAGEPRSLLDDPPPGLLDRDCIGSGMMAQDMLSYLPDDILCKVDRASMHVGLETRAPFLDPGVIEVASRIPPSMRFRGRKGKWALRKVLERHVPRALFDRPKMGFSVPVGEWLRGPLRDWAEELLSQQALDDTGLLRPQPVQTMWSEHKAGRCDWAKQLWTILMLQAWSRSSLVPSAAMTRAGSTLAGKPADRNKGDL